MASLAPFEAVEYAGGFAGGFHDAEVMGLTRVTYMVSISSRVRPFDSIRKKKQITTQAAQQPANTRP